VTGATPSSVTLATFNVHMGVDGWGRPFDVVAQCAALGADILVMQESFAPDDGSPSTAERVATALGYRMVREEGLAHGRLYAPIASSSRRWAPSLSQVRKTLRLDQEPFKRAAGPPGRESVPGDWGVAILSRLATRDVSVIQLGQLKRDAARRAVILATIDMAGGSLTIGGTHMSHITHGSHAQYRRLSRLLPAPSEAAVLTGDMNLWGPPTTSYFRGWRRAVTGRSWPAHRPHSQLDHILVTRTVAVVSARIGEFAGSDHRPAVAILTRA
jgi:endonuclease/exonuclease/phosphatase family metal-dependent hydrolase